MKTLIAIVNARHRPDWRDIIRRTWLPQVPKDRADALFFVGQGNPISDPEGVVELECKDEYKELPSKVKTITQWALKNDYDHMLKIDDDVVLRPDKFLDSGYESRDFSGCINRPGLCPVTFGFCYTLNKKSMGIISKSILPLDFDDEKWVAQCLYSQSVPLTNVDGYSLHQRMTDSPVVKIARCVHLDSSHTQAQKLAEFERIFKSPMWEGTLETLVSTAPPARGAYRYDRTGLITNWWDRHR